MGAAQPAITAVANRARLMVLAVLLVVAAAGWAVFLAQSADGSMDMGSGGAGAGAAAAADRMGPMSDHVGSTAHGMGPLDGSTTVGSTPAGAPGLSMGGDVLAFLGSWVAMMAAMMLPAAAPMVLLYARTQPGRPVNVGLFTGSYLLLWAALGLVAFGLALSVEGLVEQWPVADRHWGRAAGALIIAAGLYQLSPLKDLCLRHCRSPLAFIFRSWRAGALGALRMGLAHGLYCAGCCWMLFLVLVPIGVMDVTAMVLVAAVVFAEKVLPRPEWTRRAAAVVLVAYGAAVVLRPALLPTVV